MKTIEKESLDFVIQYLYSEHGICNPTDEAAPYTPGELKEMAISILNMRNDPDLPSFLGGPCENPMQSFNDHECFDCKMDCPIGGDK